MIRILVFAAAPALAFWDYGHQLITTVIEHRTRNGLNDFTGLTMAHFDKLQAAFELWQATGDFPCKEVYCATYHWGACLPDYLRMEEGRFVNHSAGRGEWGKNLIHGMSEIFNDELHWFTPHFPPEECSDCFFAGTCGYDEVSQCGDEVEPFCYDPCSTEPADWWAPDVLDGVPGWMAFLLDELKTSALGTDTSDRWSIASWNRMFYFFLHMYGDIHTPLHVGGASESHCFESIDGSGVFMRANAENIGCPDQLLFPRMAAQKQHVLLTHMLWDSLLWHDDKGLIPPRQKSFEDYYESLEDMSDLTNQLNLDAQYVLQKYPYNEMASKYDLDANFETIAKESHWWSRHFIYNFTLLDRGAYDCRDEPGRFREEWTCVPDWYVEKGHDIAISRIALTAYRMERHLADIIDSLDLESLKSQIVQNVCTHGHKFNFCVEDGEVRSLMEKLETKIKARNIRREKEAKRKN